MNAYLHTITSVKLILMSPNAPLALSKTFALAILSFNSSKTKRSIKTIS